MQDKKPQHDGLRYLQQILEWMARDDYTAAHTVYAYVINKFPQMNPRTRIQPNEMPYQREITVLDTQAFARQIQESYHWVPVSGWKKFQHELKRTYPDDPEYRWQYSTWLVQAALRLPYYQFWRTMGWLVNKWSWKKQGMEMTLDERIPEPPKRTLKVYDFGHPIWDSWFGSQKGPAFMYFFCAYDPVEDMLFVFVKDGKVPEYAPEPGYQSPDFYIYPDKGLLGGS